MELTNSQEEYLKTIYRLGSKRTKIRVTDIATELNITKPSVNKAINFLKEIRLIEYEAYGDIHLTTKGEKIAKDILKKQDLVEIFLAGILCVDVEQAKKESIAIKSVISKETEEKLHRYIQDIINSEGIQCKCNYDKESINCKECAKTKVIEKIKENKNWEKTLSKKGE